MEQEARETGAVSRNQNAVYVMPHDWASIAQFLGPLLERIDDDNRGLQLLVITPDAEVAAAVTASTVKVLDGRDVQIIAATSAARALRLMRIRPPQVLAGPPSTIVELLRAASLKLDSVKMVCIAWADELLARGQAEALETLMAEVPKEAARTIVAAQLSPSIEELVERYARRARRIAAPTTTTGPTTPIEYVTMSAHGRLNALRRVLDELNPSSALIFVRDRDRVNEVNDLLRSIGYGADDSVRVGLAASPGTELVVLYDLPASAEELHEAAGAAARAIALIQPRQLISLRTLAGGGSVRPFTLPESGLRARDVDTRLRAEVRAVLEEGTFGRQLLSIEPLLDEYDGTEIAAAALQLLEREREAHKAAAAASPSGGTTRDAANMVRLFVSVGARDNARPGDLVGAMANQGGVSSAELGKVDIRDSHSIIEVSAGVADVLIEKVTGTTIKGRRAIVRRDEGRGREAGGGERSGGKRDSRGPRQDRGAPRDEPRGGSRPDSRGERRPPRSPRPASRSPREGRE